MGFSNYNSQKHDTYYFDKDYKLAVDFSPVLHKPFLTKQKLERVIGDITYRKINVWSGKDLISNSREKDDSGWRRFSFIDVVILQIVSALRKLGLSANKIKALVQKISSTTFVQATKEGKQERVRFLELEYSFFKAINGEKTLLLIDTDADEPIRFGPESKVLIQYLVDWGGASSFVVLPFFTYVQRLVKTSGEDITVNGRSSIQSLLLQLHSKPTAKEQKIIDVIRNKAYEEIAIVKRGGDSFTIRAKSHRRGTFSDEDVVKIINDKAFQTVAVSMANGRKITIEREETIKV